MHKKKANKNMIGFRVEPELLDALERSSIRRNLSVHELSKQIVVEHFKDEDEILSLVNHLESVEDLVRNLGIDLAIGLRQILLSEAESQIVDPWIRKELSCSNWKRKR